MRVSARAARVDDHEAVAALVADARAAVASDRGGEQWLATDAPAVPSAAELGGGGRTWLVGCIDDVPLGVAACSSVRWPDGRSVVRVEVVYVDPGAREVGIGEALVDAVFAAAAASSSAGVEAVALPGQRELKNLFERVGLVARAIVTYRAV
jgi:GNAT superfamily N-acetyltransferase